jgi:uncharacterized protein (TIGR01319 family)
MRPYLLIDFGSTYTKLTAVDLDGPAVLGTGSARTTVADGLVAGYRQALRQLEKRVGPLDYAKRLAASSAAGGLRIVASGLVPELTGEAARQAALGAGGRVIRSFGFELTPADREELLELQPDLVLLAGGTDGGNREILLHNARLLAESGLAAPVIVAGNRTAAPEAAGLLAAAGKLVYETANVLPRLGVLHTGPAQRRIREIFLERIIRAKGLDQVATMIDGIVMPTPAAALQAAVRLADGAGPEAPGLGDLLLVDVGGATTDVHSVAEGLPTRADVTLRGLPEPRVKRTVEGDLGMRYSAPAVLEAFGPERLARLSGLTPAEVEEGIARRGADPDYLPGNPAESALDAALGFLAVQGAVERHAGRLEQVFAPQGMALVQTGKDLSRLRTVIGTGGVLVHSAEPQRILRGALYDPAAAAVLKPQEPRLYLDRNYLLPTLGLLAGEHPREAFQLLKGALAEAGPARSGADRRADAGEKPLRAGKG